MINSTAYLHHYLDGTLCGYSHLVPTENLRHLATYRDQVIGNSADAESSEQGAALQCWHEGIRELADSFPHLGKRKQGLLMLAYSIIQEDL